MNLKPQSIHLELLTPAWATGANQQQAELRVPTFRGQLRFWLRILFPDENLDECILGRADARGAQSSCVSLRLRSWNISTNTQNLDDYTGKSGNDALKDPEAYFLWPLRPTRTSQQKRGVILPPTASSTASFNLELIWLPFAANRRDQLENKLQRAIDAFGLLGAFGTRSTRGYGSVWPKDRDYSTPEALAQDLDFLPDSVSVRLLPEVAHSGRDALAETAKWFRKLRLGTARFGGTPSEWGKNDHDVALHPSPQKVLYRPALGLPLAQNYRGGPKLQTKYQWSDPDTGQKTWNDRYPSPVRFKVVRIGGAYRTIIVVLRDLVLPETTRLRVDQQGNGIGQVQLSHELLDHILALGEKLH